MKLRILSAFLFFTASLFSQQQYLRQDTVSVFAGNHRQPYAWAGGMNSCQYSDIDLNQDGIMDLFVYDRSLYKITTFLNLGTANQPSYVYAPQYIPAFPGMKDWCLLRDFDGDGKSDIFTGNANMVKVYRNVSTTQTGLAFQVYTNEVRADITPNSPPTYDAIFVSWIDVPAIRDVDGDGDLDILNYGTGGIQVEYYKNMSEEMYGNADSLNYVLTTLCWGEYSESQLDATITLHTPCPQPPLVKNPDVTHNPMLHNGSCLECINTDGDNDQDLLVGDLSNYYINYIRNGGTSSYAIGDSVDDHYPAYDTVANIIAFGCGYHVDVDNDGNKDVLFSANSMSNSQNWNSSWYYHNTGTNNSVHLSFVQRDFLQGGMIDVGEGAYPVFFDYDHDGDPDLFLGNRGYSDASGVMRSSIALYKNIGSSTAPMFSLVSSDFGGFYGTDSLIIAGFAPTFGDIDGDGDADMITGDVNGKLQYFRKDPGSDTNFVYDTPNYMGIDVGSNATPQLIDVDHDGLLDLLIGAQSGNVNYYRNTGTASSPNFTLVTNMFGNIMVTETGFITGYSAPCLFMHNGAYEMYVGSERGYVFHYTNIDGNLSGNFTLSDSLSVSHYEGGRCVPFVADVNGDSTMDIIIGNYAGGISLFFGDQNFSVQEHLPSFMVYSLYPNPANGSFTIGTTVTPGDPKTLSLYSVSGSLLLEEKIVAGKTIIDTKDLPPGIYFCTVRDASGFANTQKLVINR
ncbi:MAG TPA: T9SS type A sorting domain-containing protein [Bacteroidia bacterium]|nr:T9SS type A sorting domain-containing protein [Bacteroidia bacterium]